VLLVDLDPQVSIGILYNMDLDKLAKFSIMKAFSNKKMTGKCIYKLSENLSLLPSYMDLQDFEKQFSRVISSELMLKDLLEELKYDYIIIDTPPQYSILTKR
jgi:chromosome partitioning protein